MNLVHKLVLETGIRLDQALEVYWDNSLTPSKENKYPLAPLDKVKSGEVNPRRYQRRNRSFKADIKKCMKPELVRIRANMDITAEAIGFEFLSAGLGRDVEALVPTLVDLGFPVGVNDVSLVSCNHCYKILEWCAKSKAQVNDVLVRQTEIEAGWRSGEIKDKTTLVYYLGQMLQNLDPDTKDRVAEHLGQFLRIPVGLGKSAGRVVYILHLRGEDNPPDKVELRNSTPYFDKELRAPIEKGFGGPVVFELVRKINYWHQVYTLLRVTAPE